MDGADEMGPDLVESLRWEWSPDEPNPPLSFPAVWSIRPGTQDVPSPWRIVMYDEEAVYVKAVRDAGGVPFGPTYRLPRESLPSGALVPELDLRFYRKLTTACMRSYFGLEVLPDEEPDPPRPEGYRFRR